MWKKNDKYILFIYKKNNLYIYLLDYI